MAGNKAPQTRNVQRATPQPRGPIVVETKYIREQEELEYARYINTFLPWAALGNFIDNQARGTDWLNIQFWLYFAESLIAVEDIKDEPELRVEFGKTIEEAFKALYACGRRYKESGNKLMRMSPMEIEMIREALNLGDPYREGLDDLFLRGVARYVNKHITNG